MAFKKFGTSTVISKDLSSEFFKKEEESKIAEKKEVELKASDSSEVKK